MTRARVVTLVLAPLALAVPGSALAACEGQGGLICGSGTPQITSAAGLQVSRGGGFTPVASGSALRGGDRVLTGGGEARLSLGPSCSLPVAADALVSISRRGGKTCASVTSSSGAPNGPSVSSAIDRPTDDVDPRLVIGAGGAAGAAALALGIGLADSGGRSTANVPTVSAQ